MRKAFKSLFGRLITETHGVLLLFRRCRNMQSAPDTKHDLFLLLSNANQPPPKQLESFVDQLRNVCHQLEQVCAVSVLLPLGAHGEAGGNRALQQGLTGLQWWQGIKQCQGSGDTHNSHSLCDSDCSWSPLFHVLLFQEASRTIWLLGREHP